MAADSPDTRQHAHQLLDQLGPGQIAAVVHLLEVMVHEEDDLSEEDRRAVAASREYFRKGGEGLSLEQVARRTSEYSMDQIRGTRGG
jgi:hypothetical protein